MQHEVYAQYYRLMKRFLDREITVDEYVSEYETVWHDTLHRELEPENLVQDAVEDLICTAYTDTISYSPTPERRFLELNEAELRAAIAEKFEAFTEWVRQHGDDRYT